VAEVFSFFDQGSRGILNHISDRFFDRLFGTKDPVVISLLPDAPEPVLLAE
jgi:hypothetical protein